jgi:hypothetical protein
MTDRQPTIDRRKALAGAGTAGALVAAAAVLPSMQGAAPAGEGAEAKPASDASAGYRLTEHIKSYYASTRI